MTTPICTVEGAWSSERAWSPVTRKSSELPVATARGSLSFFVTITPTIFGLPAGSLRHGWEVMQFFPLEVERDEDGTYVVSDAMLHMYGSGQSQQEALQDYISSLIDYYQLVQQGAEGGSDKDRHELERVRGYLRPVSD